MARRRPPSRAIDVTAYADAALRLAGASLLEALALVIWNLGTRSPVRIARDMWGAVTRRRALFSCGVRIVVGVIFFVAAFVMVLPAVDDLASDLVPIDLLTIVAALSIELLVGDDLRALAVGREPFSRT